MSMHGTEVRHTNKKRKDSAPAKQTPVCCAALCHILTSRSKVYLTMYQYLIGLHGADLWDANKKRKDDAHAKQPPGGRANQGQEGSIDNFRGCEDRERGFETAAGGGGSASADRPASLYAQV